MLVTRAGLSPVMVGRDAELAQLRQLATEASTPTIALIGGEPGIGKTRLASELVSEVAPGTTLLLCQADPGGLGRPYQLLVDLAGERHPELTDVLRAGDQLGRARAAVDLLRSLVDGGPTLLVVDDLHWADPDSLAVFERLDEVTNGPLLLVGTYRPDELSRRHPLAVALERLDRRRGVTHLRLQRLAPADTARFLTAVYNRQLPRRSVTLLHNRTGGNPFFLEELLKAAGQADLDEIHTLPLPWNLAEALRNQLDGLAPEQREVVEAAAVLGARVSFDMLATVTGRGEPELIAALRELVDRGLLVETEDDHFSFRHVLTREAVTGEMLARQRRRVHEVALEALLAADAPDLAAVAVHARGAGRYQEMISAARRAAVARLDTGAAYAALALAELALEEAPDDFALLVLAGTAAWRAGYVNDARQHAERALRAAVGDRERVAALTQLVRISWEQGEHADMDRYTARVRELIEDLPDGEERAQAMAAVAQAYMLREGPDDPVQWADHASEVAERHGLKEVRIAAMVEKGSSLVRKPTTAQLGRELLTAAASEAEDLGSYLEAARAWHNLFYFLPVRDPAAPQVLERVREAGQRAGLAALSIGAYYGGRAWLSIIDGDLEAAIAVLEQGRRDELGLTAVDPVSGGAVMLHVALDRRKHLRGRLIELYLERGDLDAAEALLTEAPPSPHWQDHARGLAFQLACRRGELAEARRLLAKLVAAPAGRLPAGALHCHIAAALAAGLSADELAPLAARDAHTGEDVPGHPLRALLAAQLAEARQRPGDALTGYLRVADLRESPQMHCCDAAATAAYRGTAAIGAARCLVHLGRVGEAGDYLHAAGRHLARWSGWRNRELAVLARRLGVWDTTTNGAVLTPREQEVAALLADGLTNLEIARRLVISRKTVAVHVSHILGKLGMSSRTQVAAWVARQATRQ